MENSGELTKIWCRITAVLAVSWTVAVAAGQYQYEYRYETAAAAGEQRPPQVDYFSSQSGPVGYAGQQTQRAGQDGARSSATFDFGPRRVAVEVNHGASEALVDYGGRHGAVDPSPQRRVLDHFDRNYRFTDAPPGSDGFALPNPDYNNRPDVAPNLLPITDPVAGRTYSLDRPTWDKNAYNLNVNYKNEQAPQALSNPSPPTHNFRFHNGFVPRPHYFSPFGPPNPAQRGYDGAVYSAPSIPFAGNRYNSDPGFDELGRFPNYRPPASNYQVHGPDRPEVPHDILYPRPSLNGFGVQSHFDRGFDGHRSHVKSPLQPLPQLPAFESTKITVGQETGRNVVAGIDRGEVTTTAPAVAVLQPTPPTPVAAGPMKAQSPAVVRPSANFETQNAFFKNLLNVPDYSDLYRSQQASTTERPAQTLLHDYKLFFQSTPGAPVQGFQAPGGLYPQSTPRPLQQTQYVFYQSTTASPPADDLQGLLPQPAPARPSSDNKAQEVHPYEDIDQKQETLYSVNGFEENTTEVEPQEPLSDTPPQRAEQPTATNRPDEVTQTYVVTDFTTKPSPTPLRTVFSSPDVGTTFVDNGFLLPTTLSTDTVRTVPNTAGRTRPVAFEPTSPVRTTSPAPFETAATRKEDEHPPTHRNVFYGGASSTTSPASPVTDESAATEATVPVEGGLSADVRSPVTTSAYESEAAKRRKKIRVYKKPAVDEEVREQEHFTVRARISKNYNGYRTAPTQPTSPAPTTPITTPRFVPRGKYHATVPQPHDFHLRLSSTQSVTREIQTQPTVAPEYDDFPTTPRPFVPTAPRRGQYSPFRQSLAQTDGDSSTTVPPRRYQGRQRFRPKASRGQTPHVPADTQDDVERTRQTETPVDVTDAVTESGRDSATETTRPRRPYQRDESPSKEERPVFSLKKHNFNGRLRVAGSEPADREDSQDGKKGRYHANYSPQRQVIKRIKVKPYHRAESAETEDQHASGSVRTDYGNDREPKKSSVDEKLVSTATVRNAILFPPSKPPTRFNVATEEIGQNTGTEVAVALRTDLDTTSRGVRPDAATEPPSPDVGPPTLDSTTARVTEKRQTVDDTDVPAPVGYEQNISEETVSETSEEKLEDVWSEDEDDREVSQGVDWEEDAAPESDDRDSSVNSALLDPVRSVVVPSVVPELAPSQNPSDIVTRIDVVTSISEDDGSNPPAAAALHPPRVVLG